MSGAYPNWDALRDYEAREHASRNGHGPDRYHGRHVDLGPLLAAPPRPVPWRVWDLVADGTVTILSGESDTGKSWLAQHLCVGVSRGEMVAGMSCTQGVALYVDAEMGPQMFVDQRMRPAGLEEPEFEYIDAMGLDVSNHDDLEWLNRKIQQVGANLVVIDSLRRLAPSKSENDSDDMAPTVAAIAKLARDTGAAILLIHHKGDSEKLYRGSTAIKDQTDALFGLLRESDDEDDNRRRLTCGRGKGKNPRYAPAVADRYLAVAPLNGGVAACEEPVRYAGGEKRTRDVVRADILAALPAKTKLAVALTLKRRGDDKTFREAWAGLRDDGRIVQKRGGWYSAFPREGTTTTPLFDDDDGQ